MTRTLIGGALALACLVAGACSTTPTTSPAQVATTIVQNQAGIRAAVERAFSVSADSIETAYLAGVLNGSAASQARTGLATSHAALLVGRTAFTASGVPTSADLIQAQVQADADYVRVYPELPGG